MLRLSFDIAGERQIDRLLAVSIEKTADLSPAFDTIGDYFRTAMALQFRTEGSRGLLSAWSTDYTAAYAKAKKKRLGSVHPALFLTGRLRASFVQRSNANNITRTSRNSFEFGSSVPYALPHHKGSGVQEQRKIIALTKSDVRAVSKIVQTHIVSGGRR